jgi:hypothetical protein
MTLAEIIAEIEAHPLWVRTITDVPASDHQFLRVQYISDVDNNMVKDQAINIIIVDKGLPGEKAYYESKPPYMISDGQFRADVIATIDALPVEQNIRFYDIISLDEDREKGIVNAYVFETPNLVEKKYGVYRKVDNSIDFIPILEE